MTDRMPGGRPAVRRPGRAGISRHRPLAAMLIVLMCAVAGGEAPAALSPDTYARLRAAAPLHLMLEIVGISEPGSLRDPDIMEPILAELRTDANEPTPQGRRLLEASGAKGGAGAATTDLDDRLRAGVLRLFGKRLDTCVIHGIVRREYRDRDDLAQPGERILFKIPCMGPWNAHFLSRLVGRPSGFRSRRCDGRNTSKPISTRSSRASSTRRPRMATARN